MATAATKGTWATLTGVVVNVVLALVKITAGVLGNSYALIADGIESTADILSSIIVWGSLKVSVRPPDRDHPYGHGKVEALAGMVVALSLMGAAVLIAIQSVREILTPHHAPGWFTLPVLVVVVVVKFLMSRWVFKTAAQLESTALRGDAWHHQSDALTSAAAFVGILIAMIGGPGYEAADDWGALLACAVIGLNGLHLVRLSVQELMDAAPSEEFQQKVREAAGKVAGVIRVEKCHARKYGLGYIVDVHVEVDGAMTVREGHAIAHRVKDALCAAELRILDVLVHVEPEGAEHERDPARGP